MSSAAAKARVPVTDLEIEEWVHQRYGFVPHPFWISHCRELFLNAPQQTRPPWHECPSEIRPVIQAAFSHFDLLPQPSKDRD
jgi:hypothetical protein